MSVRDAFDPSRVEDKAGNLETDEERTPIGQFSCGINRGEEMFPTGRLGCGVHSDEVRQRDVHRERKQASLTEHLGYMHQE